MKKPKKTGDARVDAAIADIVRDLPRLVSCGRVDVVTAGEPFVIPHTLGSVPEFFVADRWTAMDITAPETLRTQWTDKQIVLVSDVAGTLTLYVGGL